MTEPTRALFLNDVAYSENEEDPLESLDTVIAFSVDDWGASRAMAWVYGIICGWEEAMPEVAARFGWSDSAVARLQRLHERFDALREVEG